METSIKASAAEQNRRRKEERQQRQKQEKLEAEQEANREQLALKLDAKGVQDTRHKARGRLAWDNVWKKKSSACAKTSAGAPAQNKVLVESSARNPKETAVTANNDPEPPKKKPKKQALREEAVAISSALGQMTDLGRHLMTLLREQQKQYPQFCRRFTNAQPTEQMQDWQLLMREFFVGVMERYACKEALQACKTMAITAQEEQALQALMGLPELAVLWQDWRLYNSTQRLRLLCFRMH